MSNTFTVIEKKGLSRRDFLKTSAASAALLTLAGCSPGNSANTVSEAYADSPVEHDLVNGEWRPAACWQTCHVRCVNNAYVVDGIPIAQKTDDSHPDSPDFPQIRGCIKGRSVRQYVLGADRLKYPMKRKNWQPGGGDSNVNAELRGKDEWERISWDEAIEITAGEFKRIVDAYGGTALCSRMLDRLPALAAFGGYTSIWGSQSSGGNPEPLSAMRGTDKLNSDRFSLRRAKLIVMWGFCPIHNATGAGGLTNYIRHAKDAGAKVIFVDPIFNNSAQGLADEWVVCRPGTDGALLAACAYHMIENNLHDQAFLDKYCVGFDADHMPPGEEGQENFKDYILGAYDGTPKTPEWASPICGASPEAIRSLAEQMATTKPMSLKFGQSTVRSYNGVETAQMCLAVGWMTGNVGQHGMEIDWCDGDGGVNGGDNIVSLGPSLMKTPPNAAATYSRVANTDIINGRFKPEQYYGIGYADWWSAMATGKQQHFLDGEIDINIKALVKFGRGCNTNQNIGMTEAIAALRMPGRVEFVVTSDFVMSADCIWSDVVLPACTPWERKGGRTDAPTKECITISKQIMEPIFEAKPDWWIDYELCKAGGIDPLTLGPEDPEINEYCRIAEATVILPDGETEESLCELTAADIAEFNLPLEPHEGRVPFKEVLDAGKYQVERSDGDAFMFTAFEDYIKDPDANPLKTASGKFEIFCRTLSDCIDIFQTTPVSPLPKYVPCVEGYDDAEAAANYPYQILGIHIVRQAHSSYGNVKSIAEYFANNLMINDIDAAKVGVVNGDTVLISNQYGKMLRRVQLDPRVMPGVIAVGQGCVTDLDEATGIDRGCNMNTVTPTHMVSVGLQAFNSVRVKLEKYTGTPLEPDYLRPQVIANV